MFAYNPMTDAPPLPPSAPPLPPPSSDFLAPVSIPPPMPPPVPVPPLPGVAPDSVQPPAPTNGSGFAQNLIDPEQVGQLDQTGPLLHGPGSKKDAMSSISAPLCKLTNDQVSSLSTVY
jgi:hypothetical protein